MASRYSTELTLTNRACTHAVNYYGAFFIYYEGLGSGAVR